MLRFNPLSALGSSRRLLTPVRLPTRFSSTTSASSPPPPPLSDGEQKLKTKLESHFDGAVVDVQDVSGRSCPLSR